MLSHTVISPSYRIVARSNDDLINPPIEPSRSQLIVKTSALEGQGDLVEGPAKAFAHTPRRKVTITSATLSMMALTLA